MSICSDMGGRSSGGATTSVNTIKDMLAGLPQFQEGKEAFSLHLDMAEKCVKLFQEHKLAEVGSVEQVRNIATSTQFKLILSSRLRRVLMKITRNRKPLLTRLCAFWTMTVWCMKIACG